MEEVVSICESVLGTYPKELIRVEIQSGIRNVHLSSSTKGTVRRRNKFAGVSSIEKLGPGEGSLGNGCRSRQP